MLSMGASTSYPISTILMICTGTLVVPNSITLKGYRRVVLNTLTEDQLPLSVCVSLDFSVQ